MRVKRLEIQGFKSFKDKTVIHFDHLITGIVGPNGCGKSNIVDAFFWVMGEQSYKHMRGTSSDDLIFNGSDKYSPLGLAEATLVMETDVPDLASAPAGASAQDIPLHLKTKEISVTRRVYRDGQGEYFINGTPARLKQVQELFMDTGVGAKGYSIIEQGQIGKIVVAKPEERRVLVEEAAGIAKYKARKKESLRKMEATELNMGRLRDMLGMMESNLDSLDRQCQKARLYQKYEKELREKEVDWGRRKARSIQRRMDEITKQRVILEQEILGLRTELQSIENEVETSRTRQTTDVKAVEEAQIRFQTVTAELAQKESALNISRQRQDDLAKRIEELKKEKEDLEIAVGADRRRLSECEDTSRTSRAAYEDARVKAAAKDEEVRSLRALSDKSRAELETAQRALMDAVSNSTGLVSRIAALDSGIEAAHKRIERLGLQLAERAARYETAQQRAQAAAEAGAVAKAAVDGFLNRVRSQESVVESCERALSAAAAARDLSDRKITQLRSRLQSLEELAAAREGFTNGARAALDWSDANGLKGGVKALVEVIDVSREHETALQGWLEGRLENLVAADVASAVEMIKNVRDGGHGRASIYLSRPESGRKPAVYENAAAVLEGSGFKVIGELARMARPAGGAPEFTSDIIGGILAGVCVVESIGPATVFISSGGFEKLRSLGGWSVVSLSGDVIDCAGTLRGGNLDVDSSAQLVVRKRTIAELAGEVADFEEKHQALVSVHEAAFARLEEERRAKDEITKGRHEAEIGAAGAASDLAQAMRAREEAGAEHRTVSDEMAAARAELGHLQTTRADSEAGIARTLEARTSLESVITAKSAECSEMSSRLYLIEEELRGFRIDEASFRDRTVGSEKELDSAQALISERERRIAEIVHILERVQNDRLRFSGDDAGLEAQISELVKARGEIERELYAARDRLERFRGVENEGNTRIKSLHSAGEAKNALLTQLAVDEERISGEISHIRMDLEQKYGAGCLDQPVQDAPAPIQDEMPDPVVTAEMTAEEVQQLTEEVEWLRERIRRIGPVNIDAVKEYDEQKTRYDALAAEKADLERSMDNLKDAIEHINRTSEERFRKAFEAIADRFSKLFPILFAGGRAEMTLVYPEGVTDILEAGVEILAQPPGKKIVNMTALSGGEKALTALSLVFAVFMVKPSPFCILDEVDAPLDDANIGKFNTILKEMTARSQFILITHNKKTMELNDTLYGVTMEEAGVSKMVSIEMN